MFNVKTEKQLHNHILKENERPEKRDAPWAIVLTTEDDWNNAFGIFRCQQRMTFETLLKSHRVYWKIVPDLGLGGFVKEATDQIKGSIDYFLLQRHGPKAGLELDEDCEMVFESLDPGCVIFLDACNSSRLAQKISALTQREVFGIQGRGNVCFLTQEEDGLFFCCIRAWNKQPVTAHFIDGEEMPKLSLSDVEKEILKCPKEQIARAVYLYQYYFENQDNYKNFKQLFPIAKQILASKDSSALQALAKCQILGSQCNQRKNAFHLLKKCAAWGNPCAIKDLGMEYLKRRQWKKAFDCFEKICQPGKYPKLQLQLADMYRDGIGTEKDLNMALAHYELVISYYPEEAIVEIANIYRELGNFERSRYYFEWAQEKGYILKKEEKEFVHPPSLTLQRKPLGSDPAVLPHRSD